ncbi:MAG: MBL fold metallo-hydrolase [Chloroflexota bacterium]
MIDQLQWLGHGSFLLDGNPIIYIDPWRLAGAQLPADIILISHDHYEHCSPTDVARIRQPDTVIIGNELVAEQIEGCTVIRAWQSLNIGSVNIKAVPAYSTESLEHPREDGGLGFVISINFYDIYYAGDTQLIPEMHTLHPDIAILPIDGKGTLDIYTAAEAARILHPRHVVPCNWDKRLGGATPLDVMRFKSEVNNEFEVVVPISRTIA